MRSQRFDERSSVIFFPVLWWVPVKIHLKRQKLTLEDTKMVQWGLEPITSYHVTWVNQLRLRPLHLSGRYTMLFHTFYHNYQLVLLFLFGEIKPRYHDTLIWTLHRTSHANENDERILDVFLNTKSFVRTKYFMKHHEKLSEMSLAARNNQFFWIPCNIFQKYGGHCLFFFWFS